MFFDVRVFNNKDEIVLHVMGRQRGELRWPTCCSLLGEIYGNICWGFADSVGAVVGIGDVGVIDVFCE